MGYRLSLGCGCDEGHFFLELGEGLAGTVWFDDHGALAGLKLQTLPAIGEADEDGEADGEEDEELEEVNLDPEPFSRWLDALSEHRAAIRDRLEAAGARPQVCREWGEVTFLKELESFHALAEHARAVGTTIEAGWA